MPLPHFWQLCGYRTTQYFDKYPVSRCRWNLLLLLARFTEPSISTFSIPGLLIQSHLLKQHHKIHYSAGYLLMLFLLKMVYSVEWNGKMNVNGWVGNGLKTSGRCLFKCTILECTWRYRKVTKNLRFSFVRELARVFPEQKSEVLTTTPTLSVSIAGKWDLTCGNKHRILLPRRIKRFFYYTSMDS